VLEWKRPVIFNVVRIWEKIGLGQRLEEFQVDVWQDGEWHVVGEGTSIGACRILRLDVNTITTRVRLRITKPPV
jgi:alpha-L-fucosidase